MQAERAKYERAASTPTPYEVKRVTRINETSYYYKFRRFIVNKLVRILRQSDVGGYEIKFVNDDDRKALNDAAGWSDRKREYIIDGARYD